MTSSIGFILFLSIALGLHSPVSASTVGGSFLREVDTGLEQKLVEHAVPLSDFGEDIVRSVQRRLDGDEDKNDGDDDFVIQNPYDFQDYSLKYATCQKIQRFSSEAVANGEYSAMIVDDIVVLRLCPKRHCTSNYQWGCNSGYGEYALRLDKYLSIMLQYKTDKRSKMCSFCESCNNRRRHMEDAENGNDDFYAYSGDDGEEEQAANDDGNNNNNNDDNDKENNDNNNNYNYDYSDNNLCDHYSYICENAQSKCNNDDDDSLTYSSYMNYLDCTQINNENNNNRHYWISPHCDSETNNINMGIFSDPYCSEYVGDEINIQKYTGINFGDNIFSEFYSSECLDCSMNYYGPYYNAQNNMCNNIFQKSGQCNTYLAYAVEDDNDQTSKEVNCAYIESIRYGTFDGKGQVYMSSSQSGGGSFQEGVTPGQTACLVIFSLICAGLAIYSCVLHHEITNLLLKSFSMGLLNANTVKMRSKKSSRRKKGKGVIDSDAETQGEMA